jgi:hypothetical protein
MDKIQFHPDLYQIYYWISINWMVLIVLPLSFVRKCSVGRNPIEFEGESLISRGIDIIF